MLEVQSFITKEWYRVLDINDINITYKDGENNFTISVNKAVLRFKNQDGSFYILKSR